MAHFAKLNENNIITDVYVVTNDDILNLPFPASEPVGIEFLNNLQGSVSIWKQTSYNNNFRKRYAGIGYTYNLEHDAFIPPQPFESWVLDEQELIYKPPVAYPTDGNMYIWDENTVSWVEYQLPTP
jgi:hypothetical protein